MKVIEPLFSGPVDIVGDVHGEFAGLQSLLDLLGYDADGNHPEGRRLVFVGDLVDRGPDSVSVLRTVMRLVRSGNAQAVLGNHELNLLRDDEKPDNLWFTAPEKTGKHPARNITPEFRAEVEAFLNSLPLVLERDDLRVVHACWNGNAVADLLASDTVSERPVAGVYDAYEKAMVDKLRKDGWMERCRDEYRKYADRIVDPDWEPEFLEAKATVDSSGQMGNPVAILTSGEEGITDEPFWAGGKWRMVDRIKWWERYTDDVPVVFGHYWRRVGEASKAIPEFGPDLFAGIEPHHWMGPCKNVYCVDFSVGARPTLRHSGFDENAGRLAALRVPEFEVVHDDGERVLLAAPCEKAS